MPYVGKIPVVGNYIKLDAITTSATATYNLTAGGVAVYPQTATNCIVSLNGIIQAPTDAYTISGSTIVFASALTTSDVIDFITVLGDVLNIGTPSDGTVSLAKLTATGTKDSTTFLRGDNTFQTIGKNTPAFAVTNSGDFSVSANTATKITFSAEVFDTDSAFDSTTNHRFTVPSGKGGKYLFYVNTNSFSTSANATSIIVQLYKNGSAIAMAISEIYSSSTSIFRNMQMPPLLTILDLVATDYIEVYGKQNGGGTIGFSKTEFGGYKIIE